MGAQHIDPINPHQWIQTVSGTYRLAQHIHTHALALLLNCHPHFHNTSRELVELRLRWPEHVPGLHGWTKGERVSELYSENLQLNLKDMSDISEDYALDIVEKSARGYFEIYKCCKYVPAIRQNMIFFTQLNHPKVWVNPSLASFQPNFGIKNHPPPDQAMHSIIQQLLTIIESHLTHFRFSQQLLQLCSDHLTPPYDIDKLTTLKLIWKNRISNITLPVSVSMPSMTHSQSNPSEKSLQSYQDSLPLSTQTTQDYSQLLVRQPIKELLNRQLPAFHPQHTFLEEQTPRLPSLDRKERKRMETIKEVEENEETGYAGSRQGIRMGGLEGKYEVQIKVPEEFRAHFEQFLKQNQIVL